MKIVLICRLIELPAYIGSFFLMETFGRRFTLCGSFLVSGLLCVVTGLGKKSVLTKQYLGGKCFFEHLVGNTGNGTLCIVLAKLFITAALSTTYSYTSELFPTAVRSTITGFCSACGRVGGALALTIISLVHCYVLFCFYIRTTELDNFKERYVNWLFPFGAFGIMSIFTGIIILALPETTGEPLPNTAEEAVLLAG